MTGFVIDASMTLAWLLNEEGLAARIRPKLAHAQLVAPWLWRLEVVNVLLRLERQKRLTQADSTLLMEALGALDVQIRPEPQTRTLTGLAQTARPHQLSAYDAVYLDLAVTTGLGLFTNDANLKHAAKRVGVKLISIQ